MVKVKEHYAVWCYPYYSICHKEISRTLFLVLFTYTLDASNEGRMCYTHDHEGGRKVS